MRKLKGFTLVELLIVIALIAILAVAIVATLNPIEQINKARDSRYKNDAAELLSAIERYYASTMTYPWPEVTETTGWEASNVNVGVCGAAGCSADGKLIDTGELKSSFRRKDQFSASGAGDKLYVVYDKDGQSVYVCFIPKANTNRENAVLTDICDDASGPTFKAPTDDCTLPTTAAGWDAVDTACFICAPEVGSIGVGTT